jgi:hypothetical protein
MSSPNTRTIMICTVLALAGSAGAQHFAMPDDPDINDGLGYAAPVASVSRPTTSFGSVACDGWVYVLGGYTGRPHDYHRDGQSRDFYRMNLYDLDHQEMLPNLMGLQSAPLETWNGQVIRTGGMVAENAPGDPARLVSLPSASIYDPATRRWSDLPEMPGGRSSHDSAVVGSSLFVFGGWTLDPESPDSSWHSDVLELDLENPDAGWTSHPMPFQRRAFATVAVDGVVALIGGMTPEDGACNHVAIFDPSTGRWTDGPEFPSQAFGAAGDCVSGTVFASAADGVVHAWAPGDEAWSKAGTMTFPRFFHQMVGTHDGDLLSIGGISRGMRPLHVERLEIGMRAPGDAVVNHWIVPTPSAAKNRQGFFVRDGWVYMFGGNNSTGQHDFEADNFLDECYRLNLATMTWRPFTDYPVARQSIQSLVSDDMKTGYALGGFGHDGTTAHTHVEGYTYDFKNDAWEATGPNLPISRSQFGLVEHGGRYWVFGGLDYDPRREEGDQFRHLTEVLSAGTSPGAPDFADSGIRLNSPRRAFGGALVGDRYYLLGGMKEDFQLVDSCEAYDFSSDSWVQITPPARTRLSPEAVAIGDKIFLAGGMSPGLDGEGLEPNKSLEMYDTSSSEWTTIVEELPFSLRHIRMVPFRSQLLIFTSHEKDANMAHVVLINPHEATGSPRVASAGADGME